jgi:hypothetical protein
MKFYGLYLSFLHAWHLKSYFHSGAIVDRFTYVVHPDVSNDAIPPWINLKDKLQIGSNLLNKTHLPGNNDIKSIKDELRPTALAAYGKQVYLDIYLLENHRLVCIIHSTVQCRKYFQQ